ncbi:MAG: hypothetical protein ACI825_001676, partial [Planctomycetota bacterium]
MSCLTLNIKSEFNNVNTLKFHRSSKIKYSWSQEIWNRILRLGIY